LLYILVRYRRTDDKIPVQTHGNTRLEVGWTVAPTLLLAVLAVPTIMGIIELGDTPDEAYPLEVTGQQFQWNFAYPSVTDAEGEPFGSNECGEIDEVSCGYIPVDRDIEISIQSQDVNHSFWIPMLAGKQDAIPGRTNRMWLNADEPGVFQGQCAEFCGVGHAGMGMALIALEEDDLQACLQELAAEEAEQDLAVCNPEAGSPDEGEPAGE
jgi:cytochrome c oxidase subunit 2